MDAVFREGMALLSAKDYAGAIAKFDETIALEPDHHEAFFNKGLCYLHRGQNEQADRAFSVCIARGGRENPSAWNNRGLARKALGDLQRSLDDTEKAIELAPDRAA